MSVLLFSSGIDSLLAKYYLKRELGIDPICIYYMIRSRYMGAELKNLQERKETFALDTTFNFGDIERQDAHIPNRNLHLAMHAASKYSSEVYIGGTASDRVSDNNSNIMDNLSDLCTQSIGSKIIISSPFWNRWKVNLANDYVEDGNSAKNLENTFSCYKPLDGITECQKCIACFRKSVILYSVGIIRHFKDPMIIKKYNKEFSKLEKIDATPRSIATMKYINHLNG